MLPPTPPVSGLSHNGYYEQTLKMFNTLFPISPSSHSTCLGFGVFLFVVGWVLFCSFTMNSFVDPVCQKQEAQPLILPVAPTPSTWPGSLLNAMLHVCICPSSTCHGFFAFQSNHLK